MKGWHNWEPCTSPWPSRVSVATYCLQIENRTEQLTESRKYESFVLDCNTFAAYYFMLIVHSDNDFYIHLREGEKDTDSIYIY